jgi:hypothetical protein
LTQPRSVLVYALGMPPSGVGDLIRATIATSGQVALHTPPLPLVALSPARPLFLASGIMHFSFLRSGCKTSRRSPGSSGIC